MRFIKALMKRLKWWATITIFLSENQKTKKAFKLKSVSEYKPQHFVFRAEWAQSLGCNSEQREPGSVLWPRDELAVAQIASLQLSPSPPDQDGCLQTVQMAHVKANPVFGRELHGAWQSAGHRNGQGRPVLRPRVGFVQPGRYRASLWTWISFSWKRLAN